MDQAGACCPEPEQRNAGQGAGRAVEEMEEFGDMKVYEALADAFVKEGVTTIFGLMGNGNMYWWHALDQRLVVRVYETRHEGSALTMAEGWARASGQPGVCTVTQGPGLTQLGTALTVATRAKVPLVVFARRHGARRERLGSAVRPGEVRRRGRGWLRTAVVGRERTRRCGRRSTRRASNRPGSPERPDGRPARDVRRRHRRVRAVDHAAAGRPAGPPGPIDCARRPA